MSIFGVVGHVEWGDFVRVERLPLPGEIIHAREFFQAAAGGGAVAAVQIAKLAGSGLFLTALTDDDLGRASLEQLRGEGLEVHASWHPGRSRRVFTHLDDAGERTITVMGPRLVPSGSDDLPWERLREVSSIYFTGGDADALRAARAARVLVATPRASATLLTAGVELDVLVRSASDPGESLDPASLDPPPRLVVSTEGDRGGRWESVGGSSGRWEAVPPPGPVADAFGCGDSFAGALSFGLGRGDSLEDALALAARCGAHCLTGKGPYAGQLTL
jgi:ribokinase